MDIRSQDPAPGRGLASLGRRYGGRPWQTSHSNMLVYSRRLWPDRRQTTWLCRENSG